MMTDRGLAEIITIILMLAMALLFTSVIAIVAINTADNTPNDRTQYAVVETEVVPALSAPGIWDADSIKISFTYENDQGLNYNEGDYSGTEGIKFLLYDPNDTLHTAVQSKAMIGQKINHGAVFYYYTISGDINGQYYITNQYARIGDDSKWGANWSYLQPFKPGTWRVVLKDSNLNAIFAEKKIVII